jgi:SAM-dependent methyltransferase
MSLDRLLDEAESAPVEGWDFSWLGHRMSTAPLPWRFDEIVVRLARRSPDLLDIGTGGGEWLARLPYRPPRTVATESWEPNVYVARVRLGPLGVDLVPVAAAPDNVDQDPGERRGALPFPDGSFSLVSSRHESFVAGEVARVLRSSGTFVTQQVGGSYNAFYDLLDLPRPPVADRRWDLSLATHKLEAVGLRVADSGQGTEVTTFTDVGALAWYLKAIPWTVPGFSIESHRPHLERLHERIRASGPVSAQLPAFWLAARKGTP